MKFAKYATLINENDLNLVNAIQFIDKTKIENQPDTERIVPELTEADKRTKQTRVALKNRDMDHRHLRGGHHGLHRV